MGRVSDSHSSTVWSICFEAAGRRLASVSDDKTVKIWRAYEPGNAQGTFLLTAQLNFLVKQVVPFFPIEGVATTGNDATWKCVCTLSGFHDRTIYSVTW